MNAVAAMGGLAQELRQALRTVRGELWAAGLLSLVINAAMLAPSMYMLQVYDRVLISQSEITLAASTVLLVGVLLWSSGVEVMRSRVLVRMGLRLDQSLGQPLLRASMDSQRLSPAAQPAQALSDLTQVRQFLTGSGIFVLFDAPWCVIYIAALFVLHPWLGVLGLVFAAVLVLLAAGSHRLTSRPLQQALEAGIDLANDQAAKLRNAEAIQAMGMMGRLQTLWWDRYRTLGNRQDRIESLSHMLSAASKFFRYTQQSLSLGAGALLVIRGELSPGAMIVGNVLMTRALQPLDLMATTWRPMAAARGAYERIQQLLRMHPPTLPGHLTEPPGGPLELRNVSATAPGRSMPILENITVRLEAGSSIALVGPSGSGKSTLARVMLGIWPCSAGGVWLDGRPLADWESQALGRARGYLPQDIELMEGTVAQNISRFGPQDPQAIIAAARSAGVHDMVLRLPGGYDTPLTEIGEQLSQGQRQRLALARALYGDPALVVLDEPNANLDEGGERALAQALAGLKARGCTVVLITHKQTLLDKVDEVIVLRAGRIERQGPLATMLAPLPPSITSPAAPSSQALQ